MAHEIAAEQTGSKSRRRSFRRRYAIPTTTKPTVGEDARRHDLWRRTPYSFQEHNGEAERDENLELEDERRQAGGHPELHAEEHGKLNWNAKHAEAVDEQLAQRYRLGRFQKKDRRNHDTKMKWPAASRAAVAGDRATPV